MGNKLLKGFNEVIGESSGPDLQDALKKKGKKTVLLITFMMMNRGWYL